MEFQKNVEMSGVCFDQIFHTNNKKLPEYEAFNVSHVWMLLSSDPQNMYRPLRDSTTKTTMKIIFIKFKIYFSVG